MVEKILKCRDSNNIEEINALEKEVIDSKNARLMFLFLYFVSTEDIAIIGNEILKTGNYRYIRFFLRFFRVDDYKKYIDFILETNEDAGYLYDLLYDVDYIDDNYRVRILNKIIELGNIQCIFKALYYYFIILDLYNEGLFSKTKKVFRENFSQEMTKENYREYFREQFDKSNVVEDPEGFSPNCYRGHKDHIPNMIVCHINHTYSSMIRHFYNPKDELSSHYIIRRDGHIKQVVSLDDSAWANGTSINTESDVYYEFSTLNLVNQTPDNANYFTFSIEHESFDGTLTEEQFKSTIKVMREIIKYLKDKYDYDFPIDREHIVGHNETSPVVRTKCPGPKFPYDRILTTLKEMEYTQTLDNTESKENKI